MIWAAVEKSPGFTPEGLIAEIRRNANYPAAEWRALQSSKLLDPKDITLRLRAASYASRSVCYADAHGQTRPAVFSEPVKLCSLNPDRLDAYQTHVPQRRGQRPSNPETGAAMLKRYKQETKPRAYLVINKMGGINPPALPGRR